MLIILLSLCTSACATLSGTPGELTVVVDADAAWVSAGKVGVRLENSTGAEVCVDPHYRGVSRVDAFRDGRPAFGVALPMLSTRGDCLPLGAGQSMDFEIDAAAKYPDRTDRDRVCYSAQYVSNGVFKATEACGEAA